MTSLLQSGGHPKGFGSAGGQLHAPPPRGTVPPVPPDLETDEALFLRYRDGDRRAFDVLFARYAPLLTRVVARALTGRAEVADVVQQTFLQVHRARFDFDGTRALKPWVMTIALNLRRQRQRTWGRSKEVYTDVEVLDVPAEPPPDLDRPKDIERLRAALAALPAGQREVIELHWLEEMPFAEVATVVGAGLSAVKVRAHRGYERLRVLLAAEPE
ncbi:MAG: RNA polymerase sigma factor [Myxococcales bacterium]|nr:RNA polymerase sigma factor [Myxococcales bacterium]